MPPEVPAQSESDVAVDAVVMDSHPAADAAAYPYAPQKFVPTGMASKAPNNWPFASQPAWYPHFDFATPTSAQYVVPQRFGMSAILGIMTALCLLFGIFRLTNSSPVMYLFFGSQAIVICVVQMFHSKTPRVASAIAGAIILPAFLIVGAVLAPHRPRGGLGGNDVLGIVCVFISSLPIGAFFGYITGTLAAGVFLVMDFIENGLLSLRNANLSPSPTPPSPP